MSIMSQETQFSKKETIATEETPEMKNIEHKKTTVSVPKIVGDRLQLYIAKNPNANLRDQSNIIIFALVEFLNKNLKEKYRIKPKDVLTEKTLVRLHLVEKK